MGIKQGSSKTAILFIVSAFVLLVALCGYCFWPNTEESSNVACDTDTTPKVADKVPGHHEVSGKVRSDDGGADAEYVMVGGVRRKASDVRVSESKLPQDDESTKETVEKLLDYGKTPWVSLDANPNVKSVVEAIREKKHPERLTPMIAPKLFDPEAYTKNPQAYLDVVEPGRAFAPAQPGKDVPQLQPVSDYFQKVTQGQSVKLSVLCVPKMPVTFTSLDLGQFSNQLTSVTVAANAEGIAETEFSATSGTINDVRIIAASPSTSGQARFIVNIERSSNANQ